MQQQTANSELREKIERQEQDIFKSLQQNSLMNDQACLLRKELDSLEEELA